MSRVDALVLVLALVNLAAVLDVVRRRRISEQWALLWLSIGALGLVAALMRVLVDDLAERIGVEAGTSLVFAIAILFLLAVCMVLSSHTSRLRDDIEVLAEEVALLCGVKEPPNLVEREGPAPGSGDDGEGAARR